MGDELLPFLTFDIALVADGGMLAISRMPSLDTIHQVRSIAQFP